MSFTFAKEVIAIVRAVPTLQNRIIEAPKSSDQPNVLVFVPELLESGEFMCPSCNSGLKVLDKFTSERATYPG